MVVGVVAAEEPHGEQGLRLVDQESVALLGPVSAHVAALDRSRFTAHYDLIRIATRRHLRFTRCELPEWFVLLSGLRHRAHTVTLGEGQG